MKTTPSSVTCREGALAHSSRAPGKEWYLTITMASLIPELRQQTNSSESITFGIECVPPSTNGLDSVSNVNGVKCSDTPTALQKISTYHPEDLATSTSTWSAHCPLPKDSVFSSQWWIAGLAGRRLSQWWTRLPKHALLLSSTDGYLVLEHRNSLLPIEEPPSRRNSGLNLPVS
eukprot:TRINITY_DN5675_c0_g1_i1.p2 TRINITY_DN5675_c0_g1~~TRINITY_DN5675_c0_g1_i1.p2  ORF type:complete len:174 (+),score=14.13 TRINITY_DN5675_c0_g1_i1:132-653(+)